MPKKKNIDQKNDVDPDDVPLGTGPMLARMRELDAIDPYRCYRAQGRTGPVSTDEEDLYNERRAAILEAAKERGAIITMSDGCGFHPDLNEMEERLMSQKVRAPGTSGPNTDHPVPDPGFARHLFPGVTAEDLTLTEEETTEIFRDYL